METVAPLINKDQLFEGINLSTLDKNPNFKEDSVREAIIMPLLNALNYTNKNIERSKTLLHPFLKIASNKQFPIKLIPDYCVKVNDKVVWVLDAKSPSENIANPNHIEQVYCYATHPEIRCSYFALCNGKAFSLFHTHSTNEPLLSFPLEEIESNWENLYQILSLNSFQVQSVPSFTSDQWKEYLTLKAKEKIITIEQKNVPKEQYELSQKNIRELFSKIKCDIHGEYPRTIGLVGDKLVLDTCCDQLEGKILKAFSEKSWKLSPAQTIKQAITKKKEAAILYQRERQERLSAIKIVVFVILLTIIWVTCST